MGRRRRYRKVSQKERAAFYEQCEKTKKTHQVNLNKQHELEQSLEILECQKRQEHERLLCLKNVPFSFNHDKLQACLTRFLVQFPFPILNCKVFRHRHGKLAGKPSGRAQITCASEIVAQILLNKASSYPGIIIEGRKLQIKEYIGVLPTRTKDQGLEPFHFQKLQIGYHTAQGFQAKWEKANVQLELNGRNQRQIAIQYKQHNLTDQTAFEPFFKILNSTECRLEFQVRNVVKCLIAQDDSNYRILMFQFRYAPLVFRDNKTVDELLGISNNEIIWERTVDNTSNGVLGCCTFYRFIGPKVGSNQDGKLLTKLRKFNLSPKISNPLSQLDHAHKHQIMLANKMNMNWWHTYSAAFAVLPFSTRYLLHALIAAHKLWFEDKSQMTLLTDALQTFTTEKANDVLTTWFYTDDEYTIHDWIRWMTEEHTLSPEEETSEILIRKVLVTPTQVCPLPPQPDFTNRIIRQFEHLRDRFIRVSFVDENYGSIFQARSDDMFEKRLRPLVQNGIVVCGHTFQFLAYSNSQLREQGCWMYDESSPSDLPIPTADKIRASMGNLASIRIIGKYGSRMGQGLSSSTQTIRVSDNMVRTIPDVVRNSYTFSDGVGMLSNDLADQVRDIMGLKRTPSAFQIRYKGAKGVVSVSPPSLGFQQTLALRPSMVKFEGHEDQCNLEILSFSKAMKCYLNRQAITILSCLGIQDCIFMNMLEDMLKILDQCITETQSALNILDYTMHQKIFTILQCGFQLEKDPYLMSYIVAIRDCLLVGLQTKARILVQQGLNLIGIMDETESIPPGHIFFQWYEGDEIKQLPPNQKVVVYRSPSLHPGDIRVLTTYDNPKLHHLVDVVVFPSLGKRPHPNEMSGGDLDGDIYSVIWDPKLVPSKNYRPMDYSAPSPSSTISSITIKDVMNFFVDYMKNDNLGVIANAHVVFADSKPEGACSSECLKLAELHSTAVDFAKTGIPATLPDHLRVYTYPDFMENKHYTSYESAKILGKIYRRSKKPSRILDKKFTSIQPDAALQVPGWKEYQDDAYEVFTWYGKELWEIMCRFEVFDEGQLLSNHVINLSRKHSNSKQQGKNIKEHLCKHVSDIQKRYEDEFWSEFEKKDLSFEVMKKASAWYQVAYEKGSFLSFPWIVSDVLCHIKQKTCFEEGFCIL